MKYKLTLEIECPRDQLVEFYIDPENWSQWQKKLVRYELINGKDRVVGAKTKIINRFRKKDIEIMETIEVMDIPVKYTCIYEAPGAWNRVENNFIALDENRTLWEFESEFKCSGILKILTIFMPGMFRNASLNEMQAFKGFAEKLFNHRK